MGVRESREGEGKGVGVRGGGKGCSGVRRSRGGGGKGRPVKSHSVSLILNLSLKAVQKFCNSSMESHSFSTKFLIHAAYHFILHMLHLCIKSHSFQRLDLDSSEEGPDVLVALVGA